MKRYETFVIVDQDVPDDNRNQFLDRMKEVIADRNGTLVLVDEWGSRKLAYEIKKKSRGYYIRLDYCGTGALVDELERLFRIDDRIMKYMTVVLSDVVDMEQIREEIAKAEAAAEAAQAAAPEETPEETPEESSEETLEQTPEQTLEESPEQTPEESAVEKPDEEPQEEPLAAEASETETEVPAETEPETKKEESE